MEYSKRALSVWFLPMHLMTQNKNAISALVPKRKLGMSEKTLWLLKHKLMLALGQCDDRYRLQAWLGPTMRLSTANMPAVT